MQATEENTASATSDKPAVDPPASRAENPSEHAAKHAESNAGFAANLLKDNAIAITEREKSLGADRVDRLARAVHNAAAEIAKELPQAGGYVHAGADHLELVSRTLRENTVDDFVDMADRYSRENPVVFVAGSVAAGFFLSRFLRGSTAKETRDGV